MTLTEFLLARISEDETLADRGRRHNARETFANDNYGYLLVDPTRVLAECEAKRLIVALHTGSVQDCVGHDDPDNPACPTLCALALPYADHLDYLREWKP